MGLATDFREGYDYFAPPSSYSTGAAIPFNQIAFMLCQIPEGYVRSGVGQYQFFFAPYPYDGDPVRINGKDLYPEGSYVDLYGVNAGSPNAEAALDFLRFLISEEGQEAMMPLDPYQDNSFLLPINRALFRSRVESSLDHIKAFNQSSLAELEELDYPALIKEAEEMVDQIAYLIIPKTDYRYLINQVAAQYFQDQISAEEAARQMADKVGLYLKEQL
jgi:ABC-type glycerol-3-phosphate transport system substrate-binding protein